ncbi:hypothetical protein WMY93_032271 [Mugilogobius chulae]|uniref:Ig-like domain-containing protein n=1 Tax=Mugilogobius chulae TaxID=88201 RepID=A0AAW0MJT1_9GOBI
MVVKVMYEAAGQRVEPVKQQQASVQMRMVQPRAMMRSLTRESCSLQLTIKLRKNQLIIGSTAAHPDRPAPSRGELQMGSATVLCVASGGFPSDWTLGWKVGGASTERSHSSVVMRGDGLYSTSAS